jgi:hypothetical protein
MATNAIKMKVSVLFTTNDKVNPIPALTMILKASKYLDAHSHIKSNAPMFADIKNVNDVAKITNIDKFVSDLQTNVHKKQFVWFFTLDTTISFSDLKYNKQLFSWLCEHQHFLSMHLMKTNYVSPIGFLSSLHPMLSSCDAMKVLAPRWPLAGPRIFPCYDFPVFHYPEREKGQHYGCGNSCCSG